MARGSVAADENKNRKPSSRAAEAEASVSPATATVSTIVTGLDADAASGDEADRLSIGLEDDPSIQKTKKEKLEFK
jgi:hypothetical protein